MSHFRNKQLYKVLQQGPTKLVSPDGQTRPLPESLKSFLNELIALLNQGKGAYLLQDGAQLTTIQAAAMLGVSRQFLVNLLEQGEIPFHRAGTHRRVYAQDLLKYKAEREAQRGKSAPKRAIAGASRPG